MFKINDPIVGCMYRLVDMDITKPFLIASVYLRIGSLYETYPTCFDMTDQSPTIGSEYIRTVWSVCGTGPLLLKAMTHTPTRPSSRDQFVYVAYLKTRLSGITPDQTVGLLIMRS